MPSSILTERLILRSWKERDYLPFYKMSIDPKVNEFLPSFQSRRQCDAFIDKLKTDFSRRGWGFWVLEHKDDGCFVGMSGLHEPGPEFGVGRSCVEIGWRLAPKYWGRGFATEAARAILHHAFTVLKLPEIVSFTAMANVRSENVMKRLHMRFEKNFDLLLLPEGHPHRRHSLYAISKEQWTACSKPIEV